MGTFLQLGHEGWNLLDEPIGFRGIVLSPVNEAPVTVVDRLRRLGGARAQLEVTFDPQLYNPSSIRGQLSQWSYFPADLDTADLTNINWWFRLNEALVDSAKNVGSDVVCSPAQIPRVYSQDYYAHVVAVADDLAQRAAGAGLKVAATVIIRLADLAAPARAFELASIVSAARTDRVYVVFVIDGVEPRQQVVDAQLLATAMHFIRLLSSHVRVQIAFSAQDLILWKAAGAHDVGTGKFLNLRRFAPGRWAAREEEGGRVVPYWAEPSLLGLIRDADVLTLKQRGLFADGVQLAANPYSQRIMEILERGAGEAWVGAAWRQYLHWFVATEQSITDSTTAQQYLRYASDTWAWLDAQQVLLLDRWNDGSWVRVWLNALSDSARR